MSSLPEKPRKETEMLEATPPGASESALSHSPQLSDPAMPLAFTQPFVLASTSRFRRKMFLDVGLNCPVMAPEDDEDDLKNSFAGTPYAQDYAHQACALAAYKGRTLSLKNPETFFIASDQMAVCHGKIMHKPMTMARAFEALQDMRGATVTLYTAACVVKNGQVIWQAVDVPEVTFRAYSDAEARAYLTAEPDAVYCAGACKIEGVGRHLIAHVQGDPLTVVGFPMAAFLAYMHQQHYLTWQV